MTKVVLISGASGFTGKAVMREFSSNGWVVIPLVRKPLGLDNEYIVDFRKGKLEQSLSMVPKCDAIVHLASHVDFSSNADPEKFNSTSIWLTDCLSRMAKKWSSHFVFTSSISVYGDTEYIDSVSKPRPNNAYGEAKLIAENIIKSEKISQTILRLAGIYGYNGPEHLTLNKAITSSIDDALIPVLKGKGSSMRNYIYVQDLARIILECVDKKIYGTHLLGGSENISIRNMLEAICETILNGEKLRIQKGDESKSFLVKNSDDLPKSQSFVETLIEIKRKYG